MHKTFELIVDNQKKKFEVLLNRENLRPKVIIFSDIDMINKKLIEIDVDFVLSVKLENDDNIIEAALQFCKNQGYFEHIKEIMVADEPLKASF